MKEYKNPQICIYHFITEIVTSGSAHKVNQHFDNNNIPLAQRVEVDWVSDKLKDVNDVIEFE